jgi:hypothetical protein
MWRAYAAIGEHQWQPAPDMPAAQVAACDYKPEGWPDDAYTVVRRVRVNADDISVDPRARRRRTIPADQLTLALGALWTRCGRSDSSSPTSPSTNRPTPSRLRRGSGSAPTSKTASATPSSAPRYGTSRRDIMGSIG